MNTFTEYKSRTDSEKITLAWVEPSRRKVGGWTVHAGSIYKATVDYFAVGVYQDATALTGVASVGAITEGTWYFDPSDKTLYVHSTGDVDPSTLWTEVVYRLFFSSAPISLPYDLDGGYTVPYVPVLRSGSGGNAKTDSNQRGLTIEGSGSISFYNDQTTWKSLFDKYTFQTKAVRIYTTARELPPDEARCIYRGTIVGQSYDSNVLSFSLKDEIYKFRTKIELPVFSNSDGNITESLIGKPKRRIYGRVAGLQIESLDKMLTPYDVVTIDGDDRRTETDITFSTTQDTPDLVATSSDVHKEICAGDTLTLNDTDYKVKTLSQVSVGLTSDKSATVSRQSATVVRIAWTGISTGSVVAGYHLSLHSLVNATQALRNVVLGLWEISTVNAAYIEITAASFAAFSTETFNIKPGELIITRDSNTTALTLQQNVLSTTSGLAGTVKPVVPYRRLNRRHFLAHHALNEVAPTVVKVPRGNIFELTSVDDIAIGDKVVFDETKLSTITSVNPSTNQVTTDNLVIPIPAQGEEVRRVAVQSLKHKLDEFVALRDYEVTNSEDGSTVLLSTTAERDVDATSIVPSTVYWFADCKQVLASGSALAGIKVRDWLKPSDESDWYEVSEVVNDNLVILNSPYSGSTGSKTTDLSQPDYISDDSHLFINCYGATQDGEVEGPLVKTASDVVKHLLTEIGITSIHEASFAESASVAPYLISLALPITARGDVPTVRTVISNINQSALGSLYYDSNFDMRYATLCADRDIEDALQLNDAEIVAASVSADSSQIYETVQVRYKRQDVDSIGEDEAFSIVEKSSEFVQNSLIEPQTLVVDAYLYNEADAEIIASRMRFMNELPSSTLDIRSKLNLIDLHLNALVLYKGDTLYERLGASTDEQYRIGLVSGIAKTATGVSVTVNDLGNLFSRSCVISPNDAPDYASATDLNKLFHGYITESNTLVDDDENTYNTNLIS